MMDDKLTYLVIRAISGVVGYASRVESTPTAPHSGLGIPSLSPS